MLQRRTGEFRQDGTIFGTGVCGVVAKSWLLYGLGAVKASPTRHSGFGDHSQICF